jgi:hypothetical protein
MAKKNRLEASIGEVNAIIGIATQLRDYRLVHFINKFLEVDLANVEDLPVFVPKADTFSYFPLYLYHHPDLRTDFCLIANSNGTSPLIPSLRQINYFLLLQGAAYKQHVDEFIVSIRKIQGVQAAISINQSNIKEIGPILEGLEMHILEMKAKEKER